MTRDDFDEICREALIERRLLADFSDGSIDKVTHTIMKIVKNRLEAAEMTIESESPDVRLIFDEIREALGLL